MENAIRCQPSSVRSAVAILTRRRRRRSVRAAAPGWRRGTSPTHLSRRQVIAFGKHGRGQGQGAHNPRPTAPVSARSVTRGGGQFWRPSPVVRCITCLQEARHYLQTTGYPTRRTRWAGCSPHARPRNHRRPGTARSTGRARVPRADRLPAPAGCSQSPRRNGLRQRSTLTIAGGGVKIRVQLQRTAIHFSGLRPISLPHEGQRLGVVIGWCERVEHDGAVDGVQCKLNLSIDDACALPAIRSRVRSLVQLQPRCRSRSAAAGSSVSMERRA